MDTKSNSDATPMEITAEDITAGIKFDRTLLIESANEHYNGKSIRIRSLRGREFRTITRKVPVDKDDLAGNFELAMEACKLGIVTPGIAAKMEELDHDILLQIGAAIIAASRPREAETEDFSGAQPGN